MKLLILLFLLLPLSCFSQTPDTAKVSYLAKSDVVCGKGCYWPIYVQGYRVTYTIDPVNGSDYQILGGKEVRYFRQDKRKEQHFLIEVKQGW